MAVSNKNELNGEIQISESGFTFVDFFPEKNPSQGIFSSATFQSFGVLVERANEFLRRNTRWKIVTCETVRIKLRGKKVDPTKVNYQKGTDWFISYIRGLRIWLTERKDEKEREQQIGYFNLVPLRVVNGGFFGTDQFETLDAVIQRFNSMQKYKALPGRIITIESNEALYTRFEKFDPDLSNWMESGKRIGKYIFFFRIFYEIMDGRPEEIGIKDFFPHRIKDGDFFNHPEYEPFSGIMKQASLWISQQGHLRFCKAQTLELQHRGRTMNSQQLDCSTYTRDDDYIRILRIAYTKPYSIGEKVPPIEKLTCRDFAPMQLTAGLFSFEFENIALTKKRISEWVKRSGARVVSAETTTYRIKSGGEKKQGTEATFSVGGSMIYSDEHWIFVMRLYLDGVYNTN